MVCSSLCTWLHPPLFSTGLPHPGHGLAILLISAWFRTFSDDAHTSMAPVRRGAVQRQGCAEARWPSSHLPGTGYHLPGPSCLLPITDHLPPTYLPSCILASYSVHVMSGWAFECR